MNLISYSSSNLVKYIVYINAILYIAFFVFPQYHIDDILGLYNPFDMRFRFYQLFTHMFIHSRIFFLHIFFNMLALWMFGVQMERLLGSIKFLVLYFISGIMGAIFQIAFNISLIYSYTNSLDILYISHDASIYNSLNDNQHKILQLAMYCPIMGASGAIAGIVGAFARFFPDNKIFIIPFPFPIGVRKALAFFIIISLILSFINYSSGIAHFAHIGGTLTGYIITNYYFLRRF